MSYRKLILGAVVLAFVATFAVGYFAGGNVREAQIVDAKAEGEGLQRAWYEGVDKAQAERAEKNRVEYEQEQAAIAARSEAIAKNAADDRRDLNLHILAEGVIPYFERTDENFARIRAGMSEESRAAFDKGFERDWRKLNP